MFQIVLGWEALKDWLSGTLHVTHHALHVILGFGLTLALARMLRRSARPWTPWFIVLGLETLNEASDFARYYVSAWPWTPRETLIDYALTMVPAAIAIAIHRYFFRR